MAFWRQFGALFWKNWIVLSKHPWLNLIRCFILPILYGIFLAVAQIFLDKPNNYGIGTPTPIRSLANVFDGSTALIWADGTNGTGVPSATDIMARITDGFTSKQLKAVKRVDTPDDIPSACPQNFNLFSECFAAIAFNNLPEVGNDTNPINYTIRADGGLVHIDVVRHSSDYEKRILPLQWAIDQALIQLKIGGQPPTPLEWPFTQETNEEQSTSIRLSYIRGIRSLLVIALFICYIGIAYQLPGAVAGERANLVTPHMKAMGLHDSARIISWHLSVSLAYLPAWIIVSIIWHYRIFAATNAGLVLVVHLLFGFSLASWSFFVAAPFGKSPQLAAVASTFLAIVFGLIALVFQQAGTGGAFVFTIIFPPGFYIFAIRAICGFENLQLPANVLHADPDRNLTLLPLLIAAIINIFLWPYLAILLERKLYDAHEPASTKRSWAFWRRRNASAAQDISPNTAISIKNLGKEFSTSFLGRKKGIVTAICDLTLDIPKSGIFVLLGSNGAGKSTALSIIGGLTGRTRGSVVFEGGVSRPPRGTLGLVPQKNVLFPELSCYQTLRLWRAIKHSRNSDTEEDIEQLLRDCDLGTKIHDNADTLSGGQKRKLQLAIGLVGGSKIVLVDECTSGVDPLSRRALWRTLTSFRQERTIIFTTHFLDEADLLADTIAILASPGKLVAEGSPVSLKRDLGEGYSVQVSFTPTSDSEKDWAAPQTSLLQQIRVLAPHTYVTVISPTQASYHLKSKDAMTVDTVLHLLDADKEAFGIASYDVLGTSIEDIFLELMAAQDHHSELVEKDSTNSSIQSVESKPVPLMLTNGRAKSPLRQAFTILHKRALIARRSWLTPLLALIVAVAGSTIPLVFITGRSDTTCVRTFRNVVAIPLYIPASPEFTQLPSDTNSSYALIAPPGILSTFGNSTASYTVTNIADNATFVDTIDKDFRNLSLGGISVNLTSGVSLVAWEGSSPGIRGPLMLNLATNVLYNNAINASGGSAISAVIRPSYQSFPPVDAGTLVALKWVAFFGAAMAVFPAFYSLYTSRERRSSVQAMQLSNGLSDPIGLWIGHLMADSVTVVIISTIIIIVFAAASNQFHNLGLFWIVLVLYGIVGALFAYCVTLFTASPLAAFATAAGYQIIMYILYLAAYLLTLTYAKTSQANNIITIIHFTLSLLSPVASVMRAAFVSVNLFSLLCDGSTPATAASAGTIMRYGGPILYLFVYAFVLLVVLVWVDSGSIIPRRLRKTKKSLPANAGSDRPLRQDVIQEATAIATSQDLLRVVDVTKSFGGKTVVDSVSFGVARDTVFAMLGPNGAGKTTTFNLIRGDVLPDTGDVLIDGTSVIHHPRTARLSLGVCPQFTAIDSQLTVREHLIIYGRLKGLDRGEELQKNVEALLNATALITYADRLASKLSGGNQRKLSLAIALIGNPPVILIDEFSTGVDAKMKRDMWNTLRHVACGKAVVITTHSMEEASALANKVGIIAKRMLAVGTTDSLSARYATYEVHFTCRTREELIRAQELMSHIPGSKLAEDVATRFEVPIQQGDSGLSLAEVFHILSSRGDFSEYTVEKVTLEGVFLKVIRENNILEEDRRLTRVRRWWPWKKIDT